MSEPFKPNSNVQSWFQKNGLAHLEPNNHGLEGYFPAIRPFDISEKQPIRGPGEGRTLSEFAKDLGKVLKDQNFFVRARKCVRLEFEPKLKVYQIEEIDPQQFRSTIEKYCWVCLIKTVENQNGKETFQVKKSISIDVSRAVLASDEFLDSLRPIFSLNTVRLPILRTDGTIELLPDGYDPDSGVFTVQNDDSKFDQNCSIEEAKQYLKALLREFCFVSSDRERASSVVFAQMLTLLCTNLLQSVAKPAFVFTANAEGAGKTLLAKIGIIARLGYCPTGTAPFEEKELQKVIFSTAISGLPLLFLDNVKGRLKSPSLEALLTSVTIRDRVLGESKMLEMPNNLTVVITGNSLTISPDMRRRALIVELFLENSRAEDRRIENPLDDSRLREKRPQILSALWALVRTWAAADKPRPQQTHNTFFEWSELIGGILEHAGFASPCATPLLKDSGDPEDRDMQRLVELMNPSRQFKFSELLEFASEYGLFETLIPESADDPLASSKRSKLSKLWNKYDRRLFLGGQRFCIAGETPKTKRYLVEQTTESTG